MLAGVAALRHAVRPAARQALLGSVPRCPGTSPGLRGGGLGALALGAVRNKQTKRSSYRKPPRAQPTGQAMGARGHIGLKSLSSEYVEVGRLICKQRKFIAKNP